MNVDESNTGAFELNGDGNLLIFIKWQKTEYWNLCDLLYDYATITTISENEDKIVLQLKNGIDDGQAAKEKCSHIVSLFLEDFLSFIEPVMQADYAWTKDRLEKNLNVLSNFTNHQVRITGRWDAVLHAVSAIRSPTRFPILNPFGHRRNLFALSIWESLTQPAHLVFKTLICVSSDEIYKVVAPDQSVARFILYHHETHYQALQQSVSLYSTLKIRKEQGLDQFVYLFSVKNLLELRKNNGWNLQRYCEDRLSIFLRKFSSQCKSYHASHLANALKKDPNFFKEKSVDENNPVYVQWRLHDDLVFVCGLKSEVSCKIIEITQHIQDLMPGLNLCCFKHTASCSTSSKAVLSTTSVSQVSRMTHSASSSRQTYTASCSTSRDVLASSLSQFFSTTDTASNSRSKLRKIFAPSSTAPPVFPSERKAQHTDYTRKPGLFLPTCVSCDECFYGKFQVKICSGDISLDDSDIVFRGCLSDFQTSCGTGSQAIVARAGTQILDLCRLRPLQQSSNIRVTDGRNLLCKHVVHVIVPDSLDKFPGRLKQALDFAELMKATSVAIPTMTTDDHVFDPNDIADALAEALDLFEDLNPLMVKRINIVSCSQSIVPNFEANIIHMKSILNFCDNALAAAYEVSKSLPESIADGYEVNLPEGPSAIIVKRSFEHQEIQRFTNHDWIDIYNFANECYVKVVSDSSRKITVHGPPENVERVIVFVQDFICEFQQSMMYETWKWSVNIKRYKRLPPRVGRVIEKALMKTERNHITSLCGHNLRIDTVQREFIYQGIHGHLLGCNHDIQGKESLRRHVLSLSLYEDLNPKPQFAINVPPNWDDMNGKMMRKIILGKTSPEYERVVNQFKASLPQFSNIIKVERIQNPFLHQQYNIRKTDVERHMTLTNPVERELFHGTTNSVTDAICIQGFSLRFSGKHGSAYGQGIYFATTSNYSSRYTDFNDQKCIFLCKVLTGDYCIGNNCMVQPPLKPGSNVSYRLYDSAVNYLENPNIFVVFNDTSAYPMYLITYS